MFELMQANEDLFRSYINLARSLDPENQAHMAFLEQERRQMLALYQEQKLFLGTLITCVGICLVGLIALLVWTCFGLK